MQTRTLASKASFGWLSWRTFFPLFALLAGLGMANSATAAVITSNQTVIISRNGNGNETINAPAFDGNNLGSYNAATGQLLLRGGSITTTESGNSVVTGATLTYTLYDPTFSNVLTTRTFTLTQGAAVNAGVRNFSFAGGAVNLVSFAPIADNGYNIAISYNYTFRNGGGAPATGQDNGGAAYTATFDVTGTPTFTPTITMTTALIAANGGADVSYDINNAPNGNPFNGADLGSFDINTGKLLLNGGTATTTENGGNNISSVTLYYRVYQPSTGGGAFNPVALTQIGLINNSNGTRTRNFALNASAQNLLTNLNVPTGYTVELYLQASGTNGSAPFNVTDNNNNNNYVATFTLTGTPIVTVVWTGGVDDNWFNPNNWNPKQIPTATTNARIPDFPSGSSISYPNIYSGVSKPYQGPQTTTNPDGTTNTIPASPAYDNTTSGNAMVRDLTMSGTSPTQRSILRLIVGRLDVFGDFNNLQQSFIQRANTTISFKSQGNQTISGNTNGFTNVEIDGAASSIKTLSNSFSIKAGGSLNFINGILQTDISQTSTNYISFDASVTETNGTLTPAGRMINENNASYFRGYLITTQTSAPGTTQDFSNIGLTTTFTGNDPGPVFVSRNTAGNYAPTAFGGANPKPSIRRVFGVQPNNPNTNTNGLNAVVKFAYFDNELVNLRVNTTNPPDYSGSVDKNKLALYVSTTGGNTFSQLGFDSNNGNVLVKSGVTTFATFTLSEQQTPLPVELISFDAKRMGANALISWATAVEISNSGFEVQVSTDGTTFRKLAFVASQAINSTAVLKYSLLDEENGKIGTRYYRLRQIDEDGKDEFSPVRVVSFSAASATQVTTLTAYPNPFNGSDLPVILVQSAVAGDATLQVVDMMGRVVARQSFATIAGIQEVSFPQASNLSSGVYMAKVTLATGEVKTIRIQKR